jgi:iron complex transport system ATP-binding protein
MIRASATAALEYSDATVGYGARAIVVGVDLAVAPGEFVGLVGPNGAGKTTLLRAATGEAAVLSGTLTLAGVSGVGLRPAERARLVAVLPQSASPTFSFSAREYVLMGRHARMPRFGGPDADDYRAADRVMALTDTARLASTPVDTLSGGDLQRLTLAQALAQEPTLLLLDEPTSHLDLDHTLQVLDLVRSLADDGMAVVAVFHDLNLAARYADRIAVVAQGAIVRCGAPAEVVDAALLAEVFHVKAVVAPDPVSGAPSVTPIARDAALPAPDRGRVLVVSGSGSGAWFLRRARVAGFDVRCAALNLGDTDAEVAAALDLPLVQLPPFAQFDDEADAAVRAEAAEADAVVIAATPFGGANVGNLTAVLDVADAGRVIVVGGADLARDFTGGSATAALEAVLASGAESVPTDREAFSSLERRLP